MVPDLLSIVPPVLLFKAPIIILSPDISVAPDFWLRVVTLIVPPLPVFKLRRIASWLRVVIVLLLLPALNSVLVSFLRSRVVMVALPVFSIFIQSFLVSPWSFVSILRLLTVVLSKKCYIYSTKINIVFVGSDKFKYSKLLPCW